MERAAFFTVANDRYFPGAVALVNSLRLVGHDERIVVTDCGLTEPQRATLAEEVVLEKAAHPVPALNKHATPLGHDASLQVLIDADVIVTASLTPLLDQAAEGRVVAFADRIDRFFPDWAAALGVESLPRRTYVNTGLVFLPPDVGRAVLTRAAELLAEVDLERTNLRLGSPADPFYHHEQDVLNAVLAALVPEEQLCVLERKLAPYPPFRGLRVLDVEALECRYDDSTAPYALHRIGLKPWLGKTHDDAYSVLLRRLLLSSDIPLTVAARTLPLHLRVTRVASVARLVANAIAVWRWRGERFRNWCLRRLRGAR